MTSHRDAVRRMPCIPDTIGTFRSAGSVARTVLEHAKLRKEENTMQTDFSLEELKAMRRVADSSRAVPAGQSAMWQSIFEKLSALIANEVCKEPELSLPRQEDQDAA